MESFSHKVALLGGTFNPVHVGHVRLALAIATALGLKRVDLVPCAVAPHKGLGNILPFALRLQMLEAAISVTKTDVLGFNPIENTLPPPSYTWNLLSALAPCPMFIIGAEDFIQLASWYRGLELPKLTELIIVPRGQVGFDIFWQQLKSYWPGATLGCSLGSNQDIKQICLPQMYSCYFVPLPVLDLSSSQIRDLYLRDKPITGLVSEAVLAILEQHKAQVLAVWNSQ